MTLTYLGAVRSLPNYNVMGLAKASLEANVRYLAACLGPEGIRVNGISAGPIKTLAAAGIGNFSKLLLSGSRQTRRCGATSRSTRSATSPRSCVADLASAITGEVTYVDCGFSTVAGWPRTDARRARARTECRHSPLRCRRHRRRPQRPRLRRVSRLRPDWTSACWSAATCWAAPRSPRSSIRASATRPRATRSACSIRRSSATSSSREHGLVVSLRPFSNFLPLPGRRGAYLKVGGGLAATQAEVARFSPRDADALPAYYAMLDRVAAVLRDLLLATPPALSAPGRATWPTARRVEGGAALPRARPRRTSATCSISSPRAPATCSTAGSRARRSRRPSGSTPWSAISRARTRPGSAYVLLHHVFGEVNGKPGQWGHAVGGMGAITQAMAAECAARGVSLRTDAPVARVLVKAGRAVAVELEGGDVIEGARVVANVNPKLLFGAPRRAGAICPDFLRAHQGVPMRVRHVPHERRVVRAARLRMPARPRPATASRERHHHGAFARRTWSRRTSTRARRVVARADRRDADPVDGRRHAGAAPARTSRACSASTRIRTSRSCVPVPRGTTSATRWPTS